MDIDSPFTMVVLIVAIAGAIGVAKTWIEVNAANKVDAEQEERLRRAEAQIETLRERVRNLEKIATDPEQRLREDFSRLA